MAYKLKKGVFLRQIGLPPLCEWKLTDELAEKYLQNDPSLARYFAFIPEKKAPISVKTKVVPVKDEIKEEKIYPDGKTYTSIKSRHHHPGGGCHC